MDIQPTYSEKEWAEAQSLVCEKLVTKFPGMDILVQQWRISLSVGAQAGGSSFEFLMADLVKGRVYL